VKNATFYEHLLKLDHWDGLRLATAQMIISSSAANDHLAGGDILRMANNIVKFKNLQTSPAIGQRKRKRIRLLTLSMDDFITSPKRFMMNFLNFVLGSEHGAYDAIPIGLRRKVAEQVADGNKRMKQNIEDGLISGRHVTQGTHEDEKEELERLLREDSVLGPILSEIEKLVNEALRESRQFISRTPGSG
jgi:hypothetical protein